MLGYNINDGAKANVAPSTFAMIKTFQFRLLPNHQQSETLEYLLRYTCRLYNEMLSMRIEAYKRGGSVSLYDQQREITHLRRHNPKHKEIWLLFQRGVIRRLDNSYKRFFKGQNNYPKFQSIRKWKSLEIPEQLVYEHGEVRIKGLGKIKCLSKRKITGKIKNAVIKRDVYGWRIMIVAEAEARIMAMTGKAVGIDVGIRHLFTTSEGETAANPNLLRRSLRHLRISQRAFARKAKGSRRHKQCKRRVAQTHWKVAERRRGLHWQWCEWLLTRYDTVAVEKLQVQNMVKNHKLALSINDVGWAGFMTRLSCKAAEVGKKVIFVSPNHTSQRCSGCERTVPKTLSQRTHKCECGLTLDRDHNAAINILKRAGISPPSVNVGNYPVRQGDAAAAFCG